MNAHAPIVRRRLTWWRASAEIVSRDAALLANVFGTERRERPRIAARWIYPGKGRRVLVVTISPPPRRR